ncbi:ATP-dependent DNA helicase II subunit 1 [Saccharata proteae CBS 121410]|uniref:ATP-dependent DNA helicase II subunit 1 n=1 Tax=Saccharata proteae CBS 121410 TaxID=1314787 RepID=A0A9P4HP45_9PEZI|nr:ATP-dependent DNA helicase II subunit 1 [Saccharata proteae CBS 121410]
MVESYNHREEGEEDEEEVIDESGYKTVKDAVLFAIDVSHSMLAKPPPSDSKKADRDSPTSAALKCAYQLMQQRIISNPNDMMGILLFGTEESKFQSDDDSSSGGQSYPHCYLLADLDVPAAPDVKRLRNLVEDEEEAEKLLVASKEPVSMANVLFCANQIFTTKAPNFSSRRLFLVTDNDSPHADDKALRSAAAVRAKDLYDLGVIIELFPISRPGETFDRTKFYDDIVYRPSVTDPEAPAPISSAAKPSTSGDGITLLQSLLSSISSKAVPKRALFNLPLELAPNLRISVKGFILIKRQEKVKSCYVWLAGETPQIAEGVSARIAEDTAREIEKKEIRKAYRFGGETVSFTEEEAASLRHFGDPIIRIIGFKPLDLLPIWANMRPATFIYPSETDYIGSIRVFSALYQKLLTSKLFGLAWFIPRRNAVPVLAALVPGAEKTNEDGDQIMPPGLWIMPLPYADDIRLDPDAKPVPASNNLTDLMRVVVQQLTLPKGEYDPAKYPNPSLQWFYRILQALALQEDLPEKPEDKTIPRYRQIHKRVGEPLVEWGGALDEEFEAVGGDDEDGTTTKMAKRPKTVTEGVDDATMKEHYEKGTINKVCGRLILLVSQLKEFAHSKHISVAGKKAELVERIEEYFETK